MSGVNCTRGSAARAPGRARSRRASCRRPGAFDQHVPARAGGDQCEVDVAPARRRLGAPRHAPARRPRSSSPLRSLMRARPRAAASAAGGWSLRARSPLPRPPQPGATAAASSSSSPPPGRDEQQAARLLHDRRDRFGGTIGPPAAPPPAPRHSRSAPARVPALPAAPARGACRAPARARRRPAPAARGRRGSVPAGRPSRSLARSRARSRGTRPDALTGHSRAQSAASSRRSRRPLRERRGIGQQHRRPAPTLLTGERRGRVARPPGRPGRPSGEAPVDTGGDGAHAGGLAHRCQHPRQHRGPKPSRGGSGTTAGEPGALAARPRPRASRRGARSARARLRRPA